MGARWPPAARHGTHLLLSNSVARRGSAAEVRLNGEKVGKAVPNGFFYVDRPAGNYQVVTETEVEKKLTFTLDAGQAATCASTSRWASG